MPVAPSAEWGLTPEKSAVRFSVHIPAEHFVALKPVIASSSGGGATMPF